MRIVRTAKGHARRAIFATRVSQLFEPRFVITGTGRSGTGYIAKLLTTSGILTGHERWWSVEPSRRRLRLVGDSSWCSAFNLDGYRGHIFHQVRHPLRVVASFAATEVNAAWYGKYPVDYYLERAKHTPLTGDPLVDAMRTVNVYLRECERVSHHTWRVEDVSPETVMWIADIVGKPISERDATVAYEAVPNTFNTRDSPRLDWCDLPDIESKGRIRAWAEKFGYL